MAVRHGYGKIAGTDALVFAYDTGDTENSYKGRPAVNYGPADLASWNLESGDVKRIPTGNYYKGQPTYNCRTALGTSWIAMNSTISGLRTAAGSSGTVTMSCMVRNNNPSPYSVYAYMGHDFGSTRTIPANSDWQKIQWTVNQSNMNNDYVEFRPYTNSADVYLEMTMPMVEVNVGNASQFVDGIRSATEGLLDLTGNSSIDLSNVSFDSNAEMAFDGASDYVDLGTDVIISPDNQGWTAEYWFNTNSASTLQHFNSAENDEFNANWLAIYNSKLAVWNRSPGYWKYGDTVIQSNTWYQAVFICDPGGTNYRYYINGVREGGDHVGNVWNATYSSLECRYIGRYEYNGAYSRYFNGELPLVRMYNRALTDAEVLQNFNHSKTRFDI